MDSEECLNFKKDIIRLNNEKDNLSIKLDSLENKNLEITANLKFVSQSLANACITIDEMNTKIAKLTVKNSEEAISYKIYAYFTELLSLYKERIAYSNIRDSKDLKFKESLNDSVLSLLTNQRDEIALLKEFLAVLKEIRYVVYITMICLIFFKN
jgi:hypothetical protein